MNTNVLKITYLSNKKDTIFYGIYYGNDIHKNKIYFLELFNRFNLKIFNEIEIPININGDKVIIPDIISIELLSPDKFNTIIEGYNEFIQKLIDSYNENSTEIIKSINDNLSNKIQTNHLFKSEITKYKRHFVKINNTKLLKLPSKDARLIGISNDNNMCPLNTLIQMLKQIDEVYYYFTQIKESDDDFLKALKFLFTNQVNNHSEISQNQTLVINRLNDKKKDIILGYPNDIIDIFNAIIDIIIDDLKSPYNFDNIINKLYYSFLLKFTYCNNVIKDLYVEYNRNINIFENITNLNKFFSDSEKTKLINIDERKFDCETKQFEKSIYLVTDETKYIFVNISDQLTRPITIDEFIELYDEKGVKVRFYPKSTAMHSNNHYIFATLENDNNQTVFNTIIDDGNVIKKNLPNNTINPDYKPTQYGDTNFFITHSPVLILYQREP
jgi:hypothetical protein